MANLFKVYEDDDLGAVYVMLQPDATIHHTETHGGIVCIDVDDKGNAVGVEFLL